MARGAHTRALPSRNGTGPRAFQQMLPSTPIPLPFGGDYAQVKVVYNLQNVMSLNEERPFLLEDLQAEGDATRLEMRKLLREFDRTWADHKQRLLPKETTVDLLADMETVLEDTQLDPETRLARVQTLAVLQVPTARPSLEEDALYDAAYRVLQHELAVLRKQLERIARAMAYKLVPYLVSYFEWPEDFGDPPDPQDAATLGVFTDLVLSWIVSNQGGLKEAEAQLRGPLSGGRS
jgi:hypothetical protein